jgi:hypothetical protein
MNQNIFDFNLLQQKSNLEYRLFEANRSIFNLQNKINMLLEVRSGEDVPPRIPRPGRGLPPHSPETPPRKPPAQRPGTVPGGGSVPGESETGPGKPGRQVAPGMTDTEPSIPWPPRPTYPWPRPRGRDPFDHTLSDEWFNEGPGRPIWQGNSPALGDFEFPFPMPNGEGSRIIRPVRGGSNNPSDPPGSGNLRWYIMANDGRVFVWNPNATPPQWKINPPGATSPYGIIGPDGYLANPPEGWQPNWVWDGGQWYPPTPPTVKPAEIPFGPDFQGPSIPFPNLPEGPYQFPRVPNPGWNGQKPLGENRKHKKNKYLMESVMRMLYKKPSFY